MSQKMVTIRKGDQEALVVSTSVKVYTERGWTVVEDESSKEEQTGTKPASTSQQPNTSGRAGNEE